MCRALGLRMRMMLLSVRFKMLIIATIIININASMRMIQMVYEAKVEGWGRPETCDIRPA